MQAANPSASRSSVLSRKRYRLPSLHITVPCGLLSNTSESGNIFGNLPCTFSPFARSMLFKTSKRKILTNRSFSSFLQKGETPNHSLSEEKRAVPTDIPESEAAFKAERYSISSNVPLFCGAFMLKHSSCPGTSRRNNTKKDGSAVLHDVSRDMYLGKAGKLRTVYPCFRRKRP